MIKVDDEKLLARIDELDSEIANVEVAAKLEAQAFVEAHGYKPEVTAQIADVLLVNEPKFNVATKKQEQEYLAKFLIEVEDPIEETAEVAPEEAPVI